MKCQKPSQNLPTFGSRVTKVAIAKCSVHKSSLFAMFSSFARWGHVANMTTNQHGLCVEF